MFTSISSFKKKQQKNVQISNYHQINRHTVSIAEAIHVPYRPQQISIKTWPVLCQDKSIMKFQVNMSKDDRKVRKTKFLQRAITQVKVGHTQPKSNLTCIMSRQIQIWNFNSICRKMTKKSPENEIFAKGNNSCKSGSNATKVKLDLYYATTNSYTNFKSM